MGTRAKKTEAGAWPGVTGGGQQQQVEDKSMAPVASLRRTPGIAIRKERKWAHADATGTLGPTCKVRKTK